MGNVDWLGELQSLHVSSIGDFIGWLERLCQQGYRVRPSWVLSSAVFEQTISAQTIFDALNIDEADPHFSSRVLGNYQWLQDMARSVQSAVGQAHLSRECLTEIETALTRMPTAHWRLQPSLIKRDSLLHLQDSSGWWEAPVVGSELVDVVDALRSLWVSTFSAQNLLYWFTHHCLPQHIKFAVLGQSLGQIRCSGFLYINAQGCQIEAVWGMSLAIARGEVIPVRQAKTWDGTVISQNEGHQTLAYSSEASLTRLDPQAQRIATDSALTLDLYVLSDRIQTRSLLSPELLAELQQLGQQLWQDFHTPAMIEWVYGGDELEPDQIWLVGFDPSLSNAAGMKTATNPRPESGKLQPDTHSKPEFLQGLPASKGKVSGTAWVMTPADKLPAEIPANSILVTTSFSPEWLPALRQVQGVITEQGGLTSHSAILARELGIPAAVGVAAATQHLHSGEWILLDGDRGEIRRGSTAIQDEISLSERDEIPPTFGLLPAITENVNPNLDKPGLYPTVTKLFVNLSQLGALDPEQVLSLDGVGLLRAEFMMLDILEQQHPLAWLAQGRGQELTDRLARQVGKFTQAFLSRPVFYRFLDLQGQALQHLKGHSDIGRQGIVGLRGALSYQYFPDLFQVELSALGQVLAAGYDNLHVLIPFVRSVAEFQFCRAQIQQAGLLNSGQMQVWMMAEVPSVLFQLSEYQQAGVQGLSIGTNDLTQLLLGIDRDHPLFGGLDERHPAVQRAIASIIRQARELGLPCSICGDAPALYPELIDSLVEWGITAISVNANAIVPTYQAIVRAEQRLLLEASRQLP